MIMAEGRIGIVPALILAAGYLLLTLPISLFSRLLERKFHYAA